MPTTLQKVVGVVKDQTSISLARVALRGSSSTIEIAVLEATSHDEVPVNDRYATEVLLLASSSPSAAAAAAAALRRRIAKTSNWVVALKSLTVIYTTIVDAGPDFRREAAIRCLLDLSSFRSSPWDFAAFVRTYALYLEARLQLSLQGYISLRRQHRRPTEMKPGVMLDRIQHWQQLLERAIGTRPTGQARTNRLVQISLCSILHESFDVYHDVGSGISLLLDNFFQLPYQSCVATVEACRTAGKLFEDLDEFYALCKNIGVLRPREYPTVQKISKDLLERLNKFLKEHQGSTDDASANRRTPPNLLLKPPAKSETEMAIMKRRGSSFDGRHNNFDMESSSPISKIPRSTTCTSTMNPFLSDANSFRDPRSDTKTNPFLDVAKSLREGKTREEGKGVESKSFEKSAWIQRLDESARRQLIHEQKMWLQHQNKMIERNLAFLDLQYMVQHLIVPLPSLLATPS